jgi:hypothetical protein
MRGLITVATIAGLLLGVALVNAASEPSVLAESLDTVAEPSVMILFGSGLIFMSGVARRVFRRG